MATVQFANTQNEEDPPKSFLRSGKKASSLSSLDNLEQVNNWINEKSIKGIQERADSDLHQTRSVYDPIFEREKTVVKDVDNFLSHKRLTRLRKKELLHKKWNERVYEPISIQLENIIGGSYYPQIRSFRQGQYQNFLDHRNRYGHVFLETFTTDDYQPMSVNRFDKVHPRNKVYTSSGADPLTSQATLRKYEDQTIVRCETGRGLSAAEYKARQGPTLPLVPKGRHGVGSREWIKFPEGDIDSPIRFDSRKRMVGTMLVGEYDHREWEGELDRVHSAQWQSEKSNMFDQATHLSHTR